MLSRRYALCFLLVIAAFVIGCSNTSKSPAPTAPTPGTPPASGTSIDLNVATPPGTQGAGSEKPVVGTVGQVTGTCPDLTFVLSGVTIHISSKTVFESGACGDVKEGVRAGAIGSKRTDGSIDAARVKIAPAVPPPPSASGAVTGLTGSCPSLTFSLSGTMVHTNDKTRFEGGACGDLKNDIRAGAMGPKDANGVIDAQVVKIAPPPLPAVTGTISALSGSCPNLQFVLSGTTVRTSDKTRFEGGACGDLKNDIRAGAMGPKDANGVINAHLVKIAPAK
jgi:hypothetical protein